MCDVYLRDKAFVNLLESLARRDENGNYVVSSFKGVDSLVNLDGSMDVKVRVVDGLDSIVWKGWFSEFMETKAYEKLSEFCCFDAEDGVFIINLF